MKDDKITSLERQALLGDKKAQEECTEKGIVLPCPCCNGQASVFFDISTSEEAPYCCKCFDCDLEIYEKTEKRLLLNGTLAPRRQLEFVESVLCLDIMKKMNHIVNLLMV